MITPFDVCPELDKSYGYYMGRDIEAMLAEDIEGVVFGCGFHNSKGCRPEHAAAQIYGKHISDLYLLVAIHPKEIQMRYSYYFSPCILNNLLDDQG